MAGRRRRLAVFVHGLGMNGGAHGRALSEGAERAGWSLYFACSNLGSTGVGTFATTLAGVAAGGIRLAEELRSVLATKHADAEEVALVGASLGGLYCRHAAGLLWGGADGMPAIRAQPHALVTLATPHLGVRGLFSNGQMKLSLGRVLSQTVSDLMWDSNCLVDLAAGPFLAALGGFGSRVAYAPLIDDGIVAYASAALSPRARIPVSVGAAELGESRAVGGTTAAVEWCGLETEGFATSDAEVARAVRTAACALLAAGQWVVIDVGVTHRELATLHPTHRNSGEPNRIALVVSEDVWTRISASPANSPL